METTPYHQYHRVVYVSSSPSANRQQQQKQNVRNDYGSTMRDLTLRGINFNRITIHCRSHCPKLFCVDNSASKGAMADEPNKNSRLGDESSTLNANKNKEEAEELPEKLPPPPEKPLPGDCCGSGCVRCVWDVYYDELEDYNKLLFKSKSKADTDSS